MRYCIERDEFAINIALCLNMRYCIERDEFAINIALFLQQCCNNHLFYRDASCIASFVSFVSFSFLEPKLRLTNVAKLL
jgi:hypothetical protein